MHKPRKSPGKALKAKAKAKVTSRAVKSNWPVIAVAGAVLVISGSVYLFALRNDGSQDLYQSSARSQTDAQKEPAGTTQTATGSEQSGSKPETGPTTGDQHTQNTAQKCDEEAAKTVVDKDMAAIHATSDQYEKYYTDALARYNAGLMTAEEWNIMGPQIRVAGSVELSSRLDTMYAELAALGCPKTFAQTQNTTVD